MDGRAMRWDRSSRLDRPMCGYGILYQTTALNFVSGLTAIGPY